MDRVQVIKQESTALGGDDADAVEWGSTPIDPVEDAIEAAGFWVQAASERDDKVKLGRTGGGHMTWDDGKVPITRKLVDLLLEGGAIDSVGTTVALTYSGGQVTEELMSITSSGLALRRNTYTYSSGQLSTEVVRVYGTDGTTIIGQVTRTYSYTSGRVTGIATVRNV